MQLQLPPYWLLKIVLFYLFCFSTWPCGYIQNLMRHPPPPLPKLMAPGYSAGSKLKFCEGDKDIRWIINTFKKYVRSFVSFNALLMAFMLAISLPCRCSFSKPQGQNTRIQNAFQKMTWQSRGFLWDFSLFNIGYQSIVYLHVPSVSQINGNYVVYKKKEMCHYSIADLLGFAGHVLCEPCLLLHFAQRTNCTARLWLWGQYHMLCCSNWVLLYIGVTWLGTPRYEFITG